MKKTFKEVINEIKRGEVWTSEKYIIILDEDGDYKITSIEGFTDYDDSIYFSDEPIFENMPTVEFMDVVNSDRQCRVYHPLLEGYDCMHCYNDIDMHLLEIARDFCGDDVKKIIKEGLWYLQPKEEF